MTAYLIGTQNTEHKLMSLSVPWYPQILELIRPEWQPFFRENDVFLRSISQMLTRSGHNITPRGLEIFTAFQWVNPYDIKVVIIGQDPYYQELDGGMTKAMGAAFSLRPWDRNARSLDMIYKELCSSVPGFTKPSHGYLESWAQQGVFLLNSSLTTVVGTPDMHPITWKSFIAKTIEFIEKHNKNLCYIRWGQNAKKLPVGNSLMKFDAAHPASRHGNANGDGFIGCNHFNQVNDHLMSKGIQPIDWTSICRENYSLAV